MNLAALLWTIIALLFLAWFLGMAVNVGWWINVLLALAIIAFVVQLVMMAIRGTASHGPEGLGGHGDVHTH